MKKKSSEPKQNRLKGLSPKTLLVRSGLICSLFIVFLFGLSLKKIDPPQINHDPLKFEEKRAFDKMKTLAKDYPNRVTWTAQREKAALWLKEELQSLGYNPQGQQFSEVIAGTRYTNLENIYAEKRGTTHPEEILVIAAHYDITDTTVEGAMDDASGVGVVLELARVFADENSERTLVFLLTDSEEFGAFWGARAFAREYPKKDQIIGVLNFDFISTGKVKQILTLCDGLKSGFTPLWFREIALDSIRSIGDVAAADLSGIEEFVVRAMQIPPADHGAFLAAGIPALNWVGQPENFAYVMAHDHHTEFDVVEAMEVDSFKGYGLAAERVIRTINSLPEVPSDFRESNYWKLSSEHYLTGLAALLIHILAFIPFLIYSLSKIRLTLTQHSKEEIKNVLSSEVKMFGALMGSLLLGYAVLRILPAFHLITQYETFPATQKSLLLYTPNFVAILTVLVSISIVYWVFKRAFNLRDKKEFAEIRHGLHLIILTLTITLALMKNSYLAALLLLPPAYFWTAMKDQRKTETRALNALLLLGGSITFVTIAVVMTTIFHVGVFYWYVFLSTAYGLISAYTVVLFFMALTVMIRLFRSFVL